MFALPQATEPPTGTGREQLRQGPGAVGVEGSLEEVAPVQVRSDTRKMGCRYSRRAEPPSLPQCTLGEGQGGNLHVTGGNRLSAREQEGTRWADLASRPLPGGPNLSHRHELRPRSPLQPGPPGWSPCPRRAGPSQDLHLRPASPVGFYLRPAPGLHWGRFQKPGHDPRSLPLPSAVL